MSLKRIFWSVLAGISLSVLGCDEDEPDPQPEYGVPVDTVVDQADDAADAADMLEDIEEEESTIAPMYGVPEYGPTPP